MVVIYVECFGCGGCFFHLVVCGSRCCKTVFVASDKEINIWKLARCKSIVDGTRSSKW